MSAGPAADVASWQEMRNHRPWFLERCIGVGALNGDGGVVAALYPSKPSLLGPAG